MYQVWYSMKKRCLDPKADNYAYYGGRGITVCASWIESYENFKKDMFPRPIGGTLERLDTNGPYSKENCCWATHKQQNRNRRDNRLFTIGGATQCLAAWCEQYGVPWGRVDWRLRKGWSTEDALSKPKLRP